MTKNETNGRFLTRLFEPKLDCLLLYGDTTEASVCNLQSPLDVQRRVAASTASPKGTLDRSTSFTVVVELISCG